MSITRHIDRNDQIYINVRITVTMGKRRLPGVTTSGTYDNGVNKKRTIENYDPKIYGIDASLSYQEVCKLFNIKKLPQISSLGRIKKNGRIMTGQKPMASGYVSTSLYGLNRKSHIVLMATAGRRPSSLEQTTVEHTNIGHANRSMNHIDKLILMSQRDQNISSYENNKMRNTAGKQREKPIIYRKLGTCDWIQCRSSATFANEFNFSKGNVSRCLHNKQKYCGNYEINAYTQPLYAGEQKMPIIIDGQETGAFVTNMSRFVDTFGVLKTVNCSVDGQRKSATVHGITRLFSILVYAAFNSISIDSSTEGLGNGMQVNHIDGNHENDDPNNLEQITPLNHATHSANIIGRDTSNIRTSIPILGKTILDNTWTLFSSSQDAGRITGVQQGSIHSAKDAYKKDGSRKTRTGSNEISWEFKSLENDTSQLQNDGELWFDVYPKHMAPNYFKRLAESIFTCQVCPE